MWMLSFTALFRTTVLNARHRVGSLSVELFPRRAGQASEGVLTIVQPTAFAPPRYAATAEP
jgi:hypothetical protein